LESNRGSVAPRPGGLEPLVWAIDGLAAEDLHALPAGEAAARVLALRGLLERLEGQWLRELAAVDARGAAGAEQGTQAPSTAGWLRGRLRAGRATDLANLALLCRAHHRAVHEGGWHLQRHPNGDLTATPPHRRQPTAA
jgi:hypothetical protein